jgi:hypothetical protein
VPSAGKVETFENGVAAPESFDLLPFLDGEPHSESCGFLVDGVLGETDTGSIFETSSPLKVTWTMKDSLDGSTPAWVVLRLISHASLHSREA